MVIKLFPVSPFIQYRLLLLFFCFLIGCLFYNTTSLLQNTPSRRSKSLRKRSNIGNTNNNYSKEASTQSVEDSLISMKSVGGIPVIIYGTAWKKERTKELVILAVRNGFRGIDTACQPKHYNEPGVGEALQALYDEKIIRREDIFLQTKFTSIRGQNPNKIPYNKNAPLRDQVLQSFQISCQNLKTSYLDSLVMHSPMERMQDTIVVWKAFEEIYREGIVKRLGMSNTYDINVLKAVYDIAEVKPSVLQNRFYRDSGYDKEIRQFCNDRGIIYQSFWTLTGNPHILQSKYIIGLANKYQKTREQIFYRFVQSLGIVPLSGTTSIEHMLQDVDVQNIELQPDEISQMASFLN